MEIIGWVRYGDKAACGGTVIEGSLNDISYGKSYSFKGARIACRKSCVIAEGFPAAILSNGRNQVTHGMLTSSGCPLQSTLNDVDGVENESGELIPEKYFCNADGYWVPVKEPAEHEDSYDEQLNLTAPPIEGVPYYVETMDGRTFSGRAGADGLLPRIDTYGEDGYAVCWGDEALAKMGGAQA
jgi:uncharacterized Zn-binding protein involved in type VI secretion